MNEDTSEFPPIVCLCGSTRFYDTFQAMNRKFTLEGKIVLSIGMITSDTDSFKELASLEGDRIKAELDELHKRKIDLANEVFIINVGGYIGESTRSEIAYAIRTGKPVTYLEGSQIAK